MVANTKRKVKVMSKPYDFAGWVTKNDLRCTDGVIIRHGAFKDNDGKSVPLVWGHDHKDLDNIIGNVDLEHRDEGVWGYGRFNTNTQKGITAKQLVQHKDIYAMSIGANRIKRTTENDVIHGNIYEVSLVVAGANPGAVIKEVLQHSDNSEGETIIVELNETLQHSANGYEAEQKMSFLDRINHADSDEDIVNEVDGVLDTLNEEQQQAVAILVDAASEEAFEAGQAAVIEDLENDDDEEIEQAHTNTGADLMHYNVFEQNTIQHAAQIENERENLKDQLSHAMSEAEKSGRKLSEIIHTMDDGEVIQHALTNPELLFPDYQLTNGVQVIYSTNTATEHILSSVAKVPTAFVKSIMTDLSDLTDEQLRAKGYIKGTEKKEQVISFLTRKTDPKTIYKKQAIDRDDAIDMGQTLNVAAFFQQEMRIKLNDEIAQAILVGDGRQVGAEGKIDETKIRPIKSDADFYTIKEVYDPKNLLNIFETVSTARTKMLGSGTPTLYVNPIFVTKLRFLRNKNDQWVFGGQQPATKEYLASLFGVKEIVETNFLADGEMIMVNLSDYQIGTNQGGEVNTFEKFDIDYNKQKYLIETRLSGALVKAKAAVYFSAKGTSTPANTSPEPSSVPGV